MTRRAASTPFKAPEWRREQLSLAAAVDRVLAFPAVADKSFLIHIGDRTVGGLVARDQLVGPWQVPVSDVAVTAAGYEGYTGEAFAMGERTPVAIHDGPASARLAVAEAVLNIAAADVAALGDIRLSANWMAAAGHGDDDYALYAMVRAVGEELCPALGLGRARRQGLLIYAHRLARRRPGARRHGAGVADRLGVRARRRHSPHADARARTRRRVRARVRRSRRRRAAARRLVPRADLRPIRRRAARRRRSATSRSAGSRCSARCARTACCSRITTAPTAACSRRSSRWRSRPTSVSTSSSIAAATDAVAYLFNEELGAVIQVPAAELARVEQLLAEQRLAASRDRAHRPARRRRRAARRYRALPCAARRAAAQVVGAHLSDAGAARRSAVRARGVRRRARSRTIPA